MRSYELRKASNEEVENMTKPGAEKQGLVRIIINDFLESGQKASILSIDGRGFGYLRSTASHIKYRIDEENLPMRVIIRDDKVMLLRTD